MLVNTQIGVHDNQLQLKIDLEIELDIELQIELDIDLKIAEFTGTKNEVLLGKRMDRPPHKRSRKNNRKVFALFGRFFLICCKKI